MFRFLLFLVALFAGPASMAREGQPALSEGAQLLFKSTKTRLSNIEKNKVFALLGFKVSKDKKQFTDPDDPNGEFAFDATIYPVDLNKDGTEELFVLYGNGFTSGMTGSSVILFIKDKATGYHRELGFPGMLPDVLASANLGYPDLLIGGPGMEFPVWRWNGKHYAFLRDVSDKDYEKLKKTGAAELSKTYTNSF